MSERNKTVPFDQLVSMVHEHRRAGRTVVHCHGVFDLVHIGHIRYLQAARRLGDILVVTITPDRFVNKGPHRPVFDESLRAQALAALDCVDQVSINLWPTAVETLKQLSPTVYVKGGEYRDNKTPELLVEETAAAECGARVEFIDEFTSSSSYLINNYLSPFPDATDRYLLDYRKHHTARGILDRFAKTQSLKVLVVGEGILDEYVTCTTLGQSTKSPNVVGRFLKQDRYLSGALAVANHLAGLGYEVQLIAMLGEEPSEESYIRANLHTRVRPEFVVKPKVPTIVKRQFREAYFATTLFEIDYLDEAPLPESVADELDRRLQPALAAADLVVVADYGHAMLGERAVQTLCDKSPFLAVSTPANAANLGFHSISKYSRADYVCLAEQDLRLDQRSRGGDLRPMLEQVAHTLRAQKIAVTAGSKGCLCHIPDGDYLEAPALATRIVDRSGAGEAFLAVTAVCAAAEFPLDELAFLGNIAGAEAVSVIGNSQFLETSSFRRHVESLFK